MYRIDIYVPETHAEAVVNAIFEAGAGHIGCYDRCCFAVSGTGRFRPLDGANPFLGEAGSDEFVKEIKLEAIFPEDRKDAVLQAMKKAHPYEQPAFQYWRVEIE